MGFHICNHIMEVLVALEDSLGPNTNAWNVSSSPLGII